MFSIVTPDTSQHVTLNDNAGNAPTEAWIVARGSKALFWAVASYARKHGIPLDRVGYSARAARPEEC